MSNFRIRRYDSRNWVLEEFVAGGLHPVTKEQGQDKWVIDGYFGKIKDLLAHLVNREIEVVDSELKAQIKELLTEIKAVEARILARFDNDNQSRQ